MERTDAERSRNVEFLLKRVAAPVRSDLPLPRLLLIFAHPDDEVLALGARLERMAQSHLLTVTDGVPLDGKDARHHGFSSLEAYRQARQLEQRAALADAGLHASFVVHLDEPIADQTACLHLVQLVEEIVRRIVVHEPEAVLTHPYEGGHPDHDACAVAVRFAIQVLAMRGCSNLPYILEAPSYHAGWQGTFTTDSFLPSVGEELKEVVGLSAAETATKARRLACFPSQTETLAQFTLQREMFREAPPYDFSQPPHDGQLLYERFGWEITGPVFRELAGRACAELFPAHSMHALHDVLKGAGVAC